MFLWRGWGEDAGIVQGQDGFANVPSGCNEGGFRINVVQKRFVKRVFCGVLEVDEPDAPKMTSGRGSILLCPVFVLREDKNGWRTAMIRCKRTSARSDERDLVYFNPPGKRLPSRAHHGFAEPVKA